MAPDKRAPRKSWASIASGPHDNGRQTGDQSAVPLFPRSNTPEAASRPGTVQQTKPNTTLAASQHTRTPSSKSWKSNQKQSPELPLYKRIEENTRITKGFCFFHSGPLSNWHTRGTPFKGERALEIALPLLATACVSHPALSTVSTLILAQHYYNCGEQWMMACKAWLMETDVGTEDASTVPGGFQALQDDLYKANPIGLGPRGQRLHASSLARIIRSSAPKDQKALGKTVRNWNEQRWEAACVPVVIAGSYARAEATPILREIYMDNQDGTRRFCEGSPLDCIWGVGIRWNNRLIDNPRHWRGKNLLGQCHDEACRMMVQAVNEEMKGEEENAA